MCLQESRKQVLAYTSDFKLTNIGIGQIIVRAAVECLHRGRLYIAASFLYLTLLFCKRDPIKIIN